MVAMSDEASTAEARPAVPYASARDLDRALHGWQARLTGGRSPSTLSLAFLDWFAQATNRPFQLSDHYASSAHQVERWWRILSGDEAPLLPRPGDSRFSAPPWREAPFAQIVQAVLLSEQWWEGLVALPGGIAEHNRRILSFQLHQWLDLISPSNNPGLNPEIIQATQTAGGANLLAGFSNFLRDMTKDERSGGDGLVLGRDLATTPGVVVFRNRMMELIQYQAETTTVAKSPVLIVPAWIMKYYILDLSPHNSLVKWLVAQGHTVFMISWRNPDSSMHDVSLDEYRAEGVMAALDAVGRTCENAPVHLTGYCLGGTLAVIAAARMAAEGDHRLASLSLFAAQTDFSDAGELQLFVSDDQLDFLADMMASQGTLSAAQMGGAFQMLRPNELIWSHIIRSYFLGERQATFDLMAWNADGTRLPARMHTEYLRSLYRHNDLAEGRFVAGARVLALNDIQVPIFLVSTETDHIAPWRSVYKLHLLDDGPITFVLTSGGHNAGIVSEPGHPHRHYRVHDREAEGHTPGPDEWLAAVPMEEGSWWPEWHAWLARNDAAAGGPAAGPPPRLGLPDTPPLAEAPGRYVLERS
ncbi:MAG TPA: alpha/beta fold hydrolase [Acidisoma sp.]|nr:alpha/beta fold hydrolase [Acidisoma sp.]